MATDPNDIRLNEEDKELLAKVADTNGKPWHDVFLDAMTKYAQAGVKEEEYDLDTEFLALCAEEIRGEKPVSLERVHEILSKVPESLAEEIIADREDRL